MLLVLMWLVLHIQYIQTMENKHKKTHTPTHIEIYSNEFRVTEFCEKNRLKENKSNAKKRKYIWWGQQESSTVLSSFHNENKAFTLLYFCSLCFVSVFSVFSSKECVFFSQVRYFCMQLFFAVLNEIAQEKKVFKVANKIAVLLCGKLLF